MLLWIQKIHDLVYLEVVEVTVLEKIIVIFDSVSAPGLLWYRNVHLLLSFLVCCCAHLEQVFGFASAIVVTFVLTLLVQENEV